jgi:hypothetical protein
MTQDPFQPFMDQAREAGVVFHHVGPMDQETVAFMGALLRRRLREAGVPSGPSRKVFSSFMEMAQNVLHYGVPREGGKFGALSVLCTDEGLPVMSGNYLAADQVPRVRARLEAVRAMAPERVREAYHRRLASDEADPDSRGAGLGLLTLAASAREPLDFDIQEPQPDPGQEANLSQASQAPSFLFLKAII